MSYISYETQSRTPQKHSGVGIAATLIGIFSIFMECGTFGLAGFLARSTRTSAVRSPNETLLAIVLLAGVALTVAGLGLAIGSLFQTSRKKLFPVLGLVLNLVPLLGLLGLIAIGIALNASRQILAGCHGLSCFRKPLLPSWIKLAAPMAPLYS